MKVNNSQPFKIIYSLYEHEFLGTLWEAYVIQINTLGKLTLQHQILTPTNEKEFISAMDDTDRVLVKVMNEMLPESIYNFFTKSQDIKASDKRKKSKEYFINIYTGERDKENNKALQIAIEQYLEKRRQKILPLLENKMIFEMGNDGEPTWKEINYQKESAKILFHFFKNENNSHYFPTIKHNNVKIEFQYKQAKLLGHQPAWLLCENKLYHFENKVDAHKLRPFLSKKFIEVPKHMEETFFQKFATQVIAYFDVHAKGFEIYEEVELPKLLIKFNELQSIHQNNTLFDVQTEIEKKKEVAEIAFTFEVFFQYGKYTCRADETQDVIVHFDFSKGYNFYKCKRDLNWEHKALEYVRNSGLQLRGARAQAEFSHAFAIIENLKNLKHLISLEIEQVNRTGPTYFLGESSIKLDIQENIDWFDIKAIIKFGEFHIPLLKLKNSILKNQNQFTLPNGEIAVIPSHWLTRYSELFAFSDIGKNESVTLKKQYFSVIESFTEDDYANVTIKRKLNRLLDFEKIEDRPIPSHFKGELRTYQKAGYDWMHFLHQYKFGGCLADDMGLGKTVQTLALLSSFYTGETSDNESYTRRNASLLIVPTSLIYNWEIESKKFAPQLKTLVHTGSQRLKKVENFNQFDLIITSYGTARIDEDILKEYHFYYIILDEAHAIKNPQSQTAKTVGVFSGQYRLTLTGTPIENSTSDLWSQMHFLNPGLLGTYNFFKTEYILPIEKKGDKLKLQKLQNIIKPFVLRRHKSQVATDLPSKTETIRYSEMTTNQEKLYEETKSYFRNLILENMDGQLSKNQLTLIQGLTKLRQIANHPKLVDDSYTLDSGKFEEVLYHLEEILSENHKVLLFSQFVKYLHIFKTYLEEKNISYCYLDGSTENRFEQVQSFQKDETKKVFLISLKAGGVGLNLTAADYVFILDPWWNPAAEAQAIDRAHRIGQVKPVFVYKFISKNTVEEKILLLQQKKIHLATELISNEEGFIKSLSTDEIKMILE